MTIHYANYAKSHEATDISFFVVIIASLLRYCVINIQIKVYMSRQEL